MVPVSDERLMEEALRVAQANLAIGQPPIAAVVVLDGAVIASAARRISSETVLDHAETVALRAAQRDPRVRARRREAALYTTLEPCLMCMGAAMSFRVGRVVYGLEAQADGATDVTDAWAPDLGHPAPGSGFYDLPSVAGGVCREQALTLFRLFAEQNAHLPWADGFLPPLTR